MGPQLKIQRRTKVGFMFGPRGLLIKTIMIQSVFRLDRHTDAIKCTLQFMLFQISSVAMHFSLPLQWYGYPTKLEISLSSKSYFFKIAREDDGTKRKEPALMDGGSR